MFELAWKQGGEEHREDLVARIEPSGLRVFPEYDLDQQFRVLRILGEKTEVPVPRVLWQEEGAHVLGHPFFIMRRVEGRVPPDNPPYHAEGWVAEIPPYHAEGWVAEIRPEERAELWWSGLEALMRIHSLDYRALGLEFLAGPDGEGTVLEQELDDLESYMRWVAPDKDLPTCRAALGWLRENRPREQLPVGFCWGDSRLGNMLFHENRCVAVLDWEMMRLGDPEEDFAWWLFFDRHHSEGCDAPRLSGFPSREETIARYEERVGRKVKHLEYYEILGAFRFTLIMVRVAQQLKSYELLPVDSDFEVDNTSSRLLAKLLDLPPPG
jgi:aminoglycoside phosphotransferase (APT) family kinase protein